MLCTPFPRVISLLFFHQQQFHKCIQIRNKKSNGSNCETAPSIFIILMEKHTKGVLGARLEKKKYRSSSKLIFFHSLMEPEYVLSVQVLWKHCLFKVGMQPLFFDHKKQCSLPCSYWKVFLGKHSFPEHCFYTF